jgi:hypothetical protein
VDRSIAFDVPHRVCDTAQHDLRGETWHMHACNLLAPTVHVDLNEDLYITHLDPAPFVASMYGGSM